jgi:hypothetical protein
VLKTVATAITLASRVGGGIVSPALFVGAMTGGAFGVVAAGPFPELASSQGLYAILGMGAVAAAVLGAPIAVFQRGACRGEPGGASVRVAIPLEKPPVGAILIKAWEPCGGGEFVGACA